MGRPEYTEQKKILIWLRNSEREMVKLFRFTLLAEKRWRERTKQK